MRRECYGESQSLRLDEGRKRTWLNNGGVEDEVIGGANRMKGLKERLENRDSDRNTSIISGTEF